MLQLRRSSTSSSLQITFSPNMYLDRCSESDRLGAFGKLNLIIHDSNKRCTSNKYYSRREMTTPTFQKCQYGDSHDCAGDGVAWYVP